MSTVTDKRQKICTIASLSMNIIAGLILALVASYGSDIKQIQVIATKIELQQKQLDVVETRLTYLERKKDYE